MKADISKEERQRLEREQWAEIRAALVRRHFATMQEQMAIDATLHRLEREHLTQAAPAINAILGRGSVAMPEPAPVVMPEPAAPPVPEPLAVRPGAPDLPFDLRQRFGLR